MRAPARGRIGHQPCTAARLAVLALLLSLWPAAASADWYLTPFIGITFGGSSSFVDLEKAVGETKRTFGGSGSLLGDGLFGVEVDFAYTPRFFQGEDRPRLVNRSRVITLSGNVILAVPARLTRESLRPYAVGGIGLMRASIEDVLDAVAVRSNLVGFNVGGGVIGFFTERTGIRLEVRHFRNLSEQEVMGRVAFGTTRLSFWRGTAGLVLRR